MESILERLQRNLAEAGPAIWEQIAEEAGVAKSLPRKIVWDKARDNPRVQTIQPLIDYFAEVERGTRQLPVATREAAGEGADA